MLRKRFFLIKNMIVLFMLAGAFVIGFAGCDNGTPKDHIHVFDDWQIITVPTCVATGSRVKVCTSCGESDPGSIIAIPIDPDAHTYEWEITTWPTTVPDSGVETGVCQNNIAHTGDTRPISATTTGISYTSYLCSLNYDETITDSRLIIAAAQEWGQDITYVSLSSSSAEENTIVTEVLLPPSITQIGGAAFYKYVNLEKITIPENVSSLSANSFQYCTNLKNITLPANLTTIGNATFAYCENLESITIPENVTTLGSSSFQYCTKLESVTFAGTSKLKDIPLNAFARTGIKSITIPAGIETIGNNAFNNCNSLADIVFEPGSLLTSIGTTAFANIAIDTLTLPANLETLGQSVFGNCSNLETVNFAPGGKLKNINQGVFNNTKIQSITIPTSVTHLGSNSGGVGVFSQCGELEEVLFAPGCQVVFIGQGTFYRCESLESITIPASVKELGVMGNGNSMYAGDQPDTAVVDGVFFACSNLREIIFESGSQLETIGTRAFTWLRGSDPPTPAIIEITIPAGVVNVSWRAFYMSCFKTINIPGYPDRAAAIAAGWDSRWDTEFNNNGSFGTTIVNYGF